MTEEDRKQVEEIFRLVEEDGWLPIKKPVRPTEAPADEVGPTVDRKPAERGLLAAVAGWLEGRER